MRPALERAPALCLALVLLASCGSRGGGGGAAASASGRTLPKAHADMAGAFARAVAQKDYDGAYLRMSEWYRTQVGKDEFLKSISRYRDGVEEGKKLTVAVRASDDDPATFKDDILMQMLVGDEGLRASVKSEAIIDFDIAGEDGWVLVAWIVEEGGAPKILSYYQDD